MKKFARIKVVSPSFAKNPLLRKELAEICEEAVFYPGKTELSGRELIDYLQDEEAVIVGKEKMTAEVFTACPRLRFIGKYGVGTDNIDKIACKKRGVKIAWSGGVNRLSVAEMTLGFMIGLCRNLFLTSYKLKQGEWYKNGGVQLSGKTVGIIGLGFIGQEVVRLLKPFGCRILVNDILDKTGFCRAENLEAVSKEQLLQEADIVTVHTPLEDEMHGFFRAETFQKMKNTAFLINAARGKIVVQKDLAEALRTGQIAGAALDVYEEEPVTDADFLSLPGLICSPHIGGNSEEAVLNMGRSAIACLQKFAEEG